MYKFYKKKCARPPGAVTTLLFVVVFFLLSTAAFAQKVTLSEKNAPLKDVFEKISKQTGFDFLISTENAKMAKPVTIAVQNEELKSALEKIFDGQPLDFVIQEKMVVVLKKEPKPGPLKNLGNKPVNVTGRVTNSTGTPLPGATVKIKETGKTVLANTDGVFAITAQPADEVVISFVGFDLYSFSVRDNQPFQIISLHTSSSALNEIQVIGYGQTTRRLNTGSISTVSATDIEKQPVTNVLSALSGRVAGVFVQTTNGLPGGNISIQIRGKGSVLAGTAPLYIIDGVPFGSSIGGSYNSAGGSLATASVNGPISPLNSLNPEDIESITILKDADATAIYGSRGSNGVVLINTKKGKAGATKIQVSVTQGIDMAASLPRLLSLQQYLQIRNEAYTNDGTVPSADPNSSNYAPDLTAWNNGKSTDWAKYLLGHTGHFNDAQATVSGGTLNSSFSLGANYHAESNYLAGDNLYRRGGLHFTFQHTSPDKKLFVQVSNSFVLDDNQLSNPPDVSTSILLPPDYPLFDNTGNYNWYDVNPAAETRALSDASTSNIVENVLLSYKLLPGLSVKASGGFNQISLKQVQLFPAASLYPGSTDYANFGNNSTRTFIVEPQVTYDRRFSGSSINILAGATYQNTLAQGEYNNATGFSNESLMNDFSSAQAFIPSNSYLQYKYVSIFGRATYNVGDKYIVNATMRRDGLSRFGPGRQFGNFGSIGAAWLFSEEPFVKTGLSWLSFGKLRASYGLTGNDQITDYQYLAAYGSSGNVYENISTLKPNRIANPDFHWETTRKLDMAVDLGFLENRILLDIDYYRNRSDDQLVSYKVPYLTGFANYQANLPAAVENKGWEFELSSKDIQARNFSWTTTFNLTIPRNALVSFQNFSTSSYAQTLALGYDITRIYGYRFLDVDPATGLASYAPQAGSASASPYFFNTIGKQSPDFYGGLGNTFSWKNWQLDVFGQLTWQKALGGLVYSPGVMLNSYAAVLGRWQKPGDQTVIPRASNTSDSYYATSSANYFDASYLRIKNVMLAYTFRTKGHSTLKVYLQGQNILTFWNKNVPLADPESGALTPGSPNLPPVKSFVSGLQISF